MLKTYKTFEEANAVEVIGYNSITIFQHNYGCLDGVEDTIEYGIQADGKLLQTDGTFK